MKQEALKLALKFVEDSECGTADLEARIKEALAQEQEPVAKVIDWGIEGPRLQGLTEDWPEVGTLLYTSPPQQTWVGLNDDEIDYLIHLAYTGDEEFVQTIEAKLKEKNLLCIKPKWIGLTEKEHTDVAVECGCLSADWVFYGAAVERKLKERNT